MSDGFLFDGLSEGFWAAAREHRLVLQRCRDCDAFRHYPQLLCPVCLSPDWNWSPASGRGRVHSYTVTHRAFDASWANRVPYAVVTIDLEEGVRMLTDMPTEDIDRLQIGAPVEVFFSEDARGVALPRFRLL
jgi:uncharacterized OB-fold protein